LSNWKNTKLPIFREFARTGHLVDNEEKALSIWPISMINGAEFKNNDCSTRRAPGSLKEAVPYLYPPIFMKSSPPFGLGLFQLGLPRPFLSPWSMCHAWLTSIKKDALRSNIFSCLGWEDVLDCIVSVTWKISIKYHDKKTPPGKLDISAWFSPSHEWSVHLCCMKFAVVVGVSPSSIRDAHCSGSSTSRVNSFNWLIS